MKKSFRIQLLVLAGLPCCLLAGEIAPNSAPSAVATTTEALWKAAKGGDCAMIEQTILAGAPVDAIDSHHNGDTALTLAAYHGHANAAKALLKHGANVNHRGSWGQTPLLGSIIFAVGNVADPDRIRCINELLAAGADPNIASCDARTLFPLGIAATRNKPVLEAILAAHPNLNAVDSHGQSALFTAAAEGKVENVKLLVGAGSDVNLKTEFGETALTAAIKKGYSEEVKFLKNSGAVEMEPVVLKYLHFHQDLSPAQTWALATTAMMQELACDPGFEGEAFQQAKTDPLKPCWGSMDIKGQLARTPFYLLYGSIRWTGMPNEGITDSSSLLQWLSDCERLGNRAEFKKKPKNIGARNSPEAKKPQKIDSFKTAFNQQVPKLAVAAVHEDSKYLAWDLCNYIWVVRSGYAAGFISKEAAWGKIMAAAQRIQRNFSSWEEMVNDFQSGLEQKSGKPDDRFNSIYRRLLNPSDKNSPWAVYPWLTPLVGPKPIG